MYLFNLTVFFFTMNCHATQDFYLTDYKFPMLLELDQEYFRFTLEEPFQDLP